MVASHPVRQAEAAERLAEDRASGEVADSEATSLVPVQVGALMVLVVEPRSNITENFISLYYSKIVKKCILISPALAVSLVLVVELSSVRAEGVAAVASQYEWCPQMVSSDHLFWDLFCHSSEK